MTSLVVKTRLPTSKDVRRFCIKSDSTSFASLMKLLKELYPKVPNISVVYQVSDREHVEVKSEEDFKVVVLHALKSCPPILRLTITPREIAIEGAKDKEEALDASWILVPDDATLSKETEKPKEESTPIARPPASQPITIVRKEDNSPAASGSSASPSSSGFSFGSLPEIFGFQLPTLSSSRSSGSLAEQIKEANKQIDLLEKQVKKEAKAIPQSHSAPEEPASQPKMRTAEVCAQSSMETLKLCSNMSDLTKSICGLESSNILQQLKAVQKPTIPSSSSAHESQLIASECLKAAEDTTKMVYQLSNDTTAYGKSEATTSVLQECQDLSKSTAEDCRNISRSIVSEIFAV